MTRPPTLEDRASGVLLHPTSLPGPYGSGDVGPAARAFVDLLASAGQRWWQMLPVAPPGYGSSPYSAESAFAGSPLLVDLDALVTEGLLTAADVAGGPPASNRVDHDAARSFRDRCLRKAFAAFERQPFGSPLRLRHDAFCHESRAWLDDFALFTALKRVHGGRPWSAWEPGLRDRTPAALAGARARLPRDVAFHTFEQLLFAEHWSKLRAYAEACGVGLIGDVPMFVAHDSADVWQHRELFQLDARGMPTVVAGVPPDYFSATGQRWGNPLYRWARMRADGYAFWVARFALSLRRFHALRLDHFIGFDRYWSIPAKSPTAVKGRWIQGPGGHLFAALRASLGTLPLVAEDLGPATDRAKALRDKLELPGIRVLQFAFGEGDGRSEFLPHNLPRRCAVYTGTHDNDTTVGWFHEAGGAESTRTPADTEKERRNARAYLGTDGREIHWDLIRVALMSVATTAIVPAQDLLGLGSDMRMNRPGTAQGNWAWRLEEGALSPSIVARLRDLSRTYGRAGGT